MACRRPLLLNRSSTRTLTGPKPRLTTTASAPHRHGQTATIAIPGVHPANIASQHRKDVTPPPEPPPSRVKIVSVRPFRPAEAAAVSQQVWKHTPVSAPGSAPPTMDSGEKTDKTASVAAATASGGGGQEREGTTFPWWRYEKGGERARQTYASSGHLTSPMGWAPPSGVASPQRAAPDQTDVACVCSLAVSPSVIIVGLSTSVGQDTRRSAGCVGS